MDKRTLKVYLFHQPSKSTQCFLSVGAIALVLILGLVIHNYVGRRVIALILMLAVSMLAIFLDIVPVSLSLNDERAFGLDKSDVVVEYIPLVYNKVGQLELKRNNAMNFKPEMD